MRERLPVTDASGVDANQCISRAAGSQSHCLCKVCPHSIVCVFFSAHLFVCVQDRGVVLSAFVLPNTSMQALLESGRRAAAQRSGLFLCSTPAQC